MIWTRRQLLAGGGLAVVMAATDLSAFSQPAAAATEPVPHPLLGDPAAPKRLVVWGSLTCPFTAALYGVLTPISRDMPETVSIEWRHFPIHKPDPALHVAGLGFVGERFWNFTFRILQEVHAHGGGYDTLTPEKIAEFAGAEGGSEATLQAAYADPAKWAAVKEDLLAGHLLGVTKTPGLFYNGYFLTPAGIPLNTKAFDASLRAMLLAD